VRFDCGGSVLSDISLNWLLLRRDNRAEHVIDESADEQERQQINYENRRDRRFIKALWVFVLFACFLSVFYPIQILLDFCMSLFAVDFFCF